MKPWRLPGVDGVRTFTWRWKDPFGGELPREGYLSVPCEGVVGGTVDSESRGRALLQQCPKDHAGDNDRGHGCEGIGGDGSAGTRGAWASGGGAWGGASEPVGAGVEVNGVEATGVGPACEFTVG
jgi:hypothetical protein